MFNFSQREAARYRFPFLLMKACLSFDLDEPDDAYNHMMASNAINLSIAMWRLDMWLEQKDEGPFDLVREKLRNELLEVGLVWENIHR